MPKLYDCLLLAKALRDQNLKLPDYLVFHGDSSSLNSADGYFSRVYVDHNHQEILFVHRGTTIDGEVQYHENAFSVGASNLVSDTAIASRLLPNTSKIALDFVRSVISALPISYKSYSHVQIGHSLGGFHAHICGYSFQHRVIAIDPPGCAEALISLKKPFDGLQCEQHCSFFVRRNLINESDRHVGKLAYHQFEEHWYGSSTETTTNTLATHSLDFFMAHIPENSPDPVVGLPENFFWHVSASLTATGLFSQASPTAILPTEIENSYILGGQQQVQEDFWLVYILNEKQRDQHRHREHAFLLLEGIKDGVHVLARYELTTPNNIHAKILVRENYNEVLQELEKMGHHRIWQYKYAVINRRSAENLVNYILEDYQKGENDRLFFDWSGTSSTPDHYNCTKWAKEKLTQIGASLKQSDFLEFYTTYIVNKPSKAVKNGREYTINGGMEDDEASEAKKSSDPCLIL